MITLSNCKFELLILTILIVINQTSLSLLKYNQENKFLNKINNNNFSNINKINSLIAKYNYHNKIIKKQLDITDSPLIFNHITSNHMHHNHHDHTNQLNSLSSITQINNLTIIQNGSTLEAIDEPISLQYNFWQKILITVIYVIIVLSTLIGNMLVILAVVIVRKLHTQDNANNFLIVSLAVSDFLVGVLAMPFAIYVELSDQNK
jgi:ABC-type sugar transport system permease subunit